MSDNPYLTTGPHRLGSGGVVWPPGAVLGVEDTAAGLTVAVSQDLPERAREAIESLGGPPAWPEGLDYLAGDENRAGWVEAAWDPDRQEVAWAITTPQRSSLASFGDDLAAAWAEHAETLAEAGPVVDRLRGLAPDWLDPTDPEEVTVTWDPQSHQAWLGINLPEVAAPEVPMTVQAPSWVATAMGTAPGMRMTVTAGESPEQDVVVVRIEGDGHPEGTTMTPDQARGVVTQAVRDAGSTPADVAWQELAPHVDRMHGLPGMGDIAVEDPVLLEDGTLSVQLHPDWDGPSTETSVTLTAPADGGPVTVRAGRADTAALRSGQTSPQRLAEDAWLTGLSPDLAAHPDPTRLSDTQAAALVLGAPQTSTDQAVAVLSAGLADARQAAQDAARGTRPLATQQFRDQQARDQARTQEKAGVTVYTTPGCMGCEMTRRQLDRAGVAYQSVDLSTRPDLASQMREQGLTRAPVIEAPDGRRTAGFDPDRIRAVVAMASSPTPPTATAPTAAQQDAQQPGPPRPDLPAARGVTR